MLIRTRIVSLIPWLCMTGIAAGCAQPTGPTPVAVDGVRNLSRDGNLYIAGTPTPDGLRRMKEQGVTTVIDLRMDAEGCEENRAAAAGLGLNYVHLPMKSDQLDSSQADRFLQEMTRHENEKVLLHCAGASRAGAMYGLYLNRSGRCDADSAVQNARMAGLKNEKLESALRDRLKETSPRP